MHRWCRIFCLLPASRLLRIASSTCCMISANFSHLKNLILCMSNHKGPNFSIEIRESLWLLKTLLIKVETHVVNFLCPNALFPTCFPTLSSTNGVSHHDLPLIRNKLLTLISSCFVRVRNTFGGLVMLINTPDYDREKKNKCIPNH